MKLIISQCIFWLSFLLALSIGSAASAASLTLVATSPTQGAEINDLVTFDVVMDFSTDTNGLGSDSTVGGGFDITFDSSALQFESFSRAELGDPAFGRDPDVLNGLLESWSFGDFGGLTGPALVGSVTFSVLLDGVTSFVSTAPNNGIIGPFISWVNFAPLTNVDYSSVEVASIVNPYMGVAINVDVQGEYAYIGDEGGFGLGSARLRIFDVSNPVAPVEVGSINTLGRPRAVMASGDIVYVAAEHGGLRMIDVSTPSSPVDLGFLVPTGSNANGVDVDVNIGVAYVADGFNGLQMISVANPAIPFELGVLDTPFFAMDVVVSGDYAYVGDQNAGLLVVDISNPWIPVLIGTLDTPGGLQGLDVLGDFVYVADGNAGVRKIDVSNPAAPFDVSVFATPGEALSVHAVWTPQGIAVVAALRSGEVKVIDFSNPLAPSEFSSATLPSFAGDVRVEGGLVYVAAGAEGLFVIEAAPIPVPEPAGIAGLLSGLALLAALGAGRRRRESAIQG